MVDQSRSQTEAGYQHDRLRALEVMLPKSVVESGDNAACPLCESALEVPDETIDSLRSLLGGLEERLSRSRGTALRRQGAVERLQASRPQLLDLLRENVVASDEIARQKSSQEAGRSVRECVSFLQGRVSQELERGIDVSGDLHELREAERVARGRVARLEQLYEDDDPAAALRQAVDSIAEVMTDYARTLQLEGSEHFVRLDPIELTVAVQRPGGRVPLSRMGSAENWVGYHLVAHLALHHWFVFNERPVPRFLMLDQPTQAFFPEEVVDAAEDENADWEAVRRQFALMNEVVASLDGRLQVIVCDHANLADAWFQSAVIDNWRNGVALIPAEWLA